MLTRTRIRIGLACGIGLVAGSLAGGHTSPAVAFDSYPCGKAVPVSWTSSPVQPCPLNAPLKRGIPVYATPVPNPRGATPPAPAGWLDGASNQYFVCDRAFPGAVYHHPEGWRNHWWAYTLSDDGVWGWVPEVFFKGGDNDEPDYALNGCPTPAPPPSIQPCDPLPASPGLKIQAAFSRSRKTATVSYGHRARVRGRLVRADGTPVAGARVCVGSGNPKAGAIRQATTIVTDSAGRFTYRLRRGASRRAWFVHRDGGGAAAASVLLRVRTPVRVRASRRAVRNGQSVLLRGKLGGGNDSRGLIVELQAQRGRRWQTFATTRTGKGGRFRYRYRFTRTQGVQRYRLRGHARAQRGSPFVSGASRGVLIKVSG